MKEIIERIAQALDDQPGHVAVTEIVGKHTSILKPKVDRTDNGKVIGK